jgi:hypothetical protein
MKYKVKYKKWDRKFVFYVDKPVFGSSILGMHFRECILLECILLKIVRLVKY